jgi:hypothetical protein
MTRCYRGRHHERVSVNPVRPPAGKRLASDEAVSELHRHPAHGALMTTTAADDEENPTDTSVPSVGPDRRLRPRRGPTGA